MHTDDVGTMSEGQPRDDSYTAPEVTAITAVGDALIGIDFGSVPPPPTY